MLEDTVNRPIEIWAATYVYLLFFRCNANVDWPMIIAIPVCRLCDIY